ncbi:LysM peptidoglycan-binding domain-containing protein [Dysgonomonas sp. Marseille-P4677]|uniref:LysM peptidoglycan-binding domain-containing protein n=1 Tax=Dysgonomonas sp. Marseille-P4677 TaxID=2364790 RepID=UPI00191188FC|nr:LysM peptidoglycan-binding domain-containing protein [Dysgonomonas sp. Marseille-P4677]MBK5720773.1 LysM peptidoglycan-binding domain-containing protein [Dysgonomonas sp. Marseille-P4677]
MRTLLTGLLILCALTIEGHTSYKIPSAIEKDILIESEITEVDLDEKDVNQDILYSNIQRAQLVVVLYKVSKHEKLSQIAKTHDVTIDELKEWNDLRGNNIPEGTELKIEKIVYVSLPESVEPKAPELVTIESNPHLALEIFDQYLQKTGNEYFSQSQVVENEISAQVLSLTEKNLKTPAREKKKDIFHQLANVAESAFSSIRNLSNSAPISFAFLKNQKSKIEETELATTTEHIEQDSITKAETLVADIANILLETESDQTSLSTKISSLEKDKDLKKIYHKVKIGETVTQIAAKYKVSKDDIIQWNNLAHNIAKIRQRLLIFVPINNNLAENSLY